MFNRSAAFALNRLLARESFARERLRPFAGQHVLVRSPPWPELILAISAEGLVQAPSAGRPPDLVITVKAAAVPLFLAGSERSLREVSIEGNEELAQAVRFLATNLRWDIEEDLSQVVGDTLAHRLANAGRALAAWQKDSAQRVGEHFAEYLREESQTLAHPARMADFTREVAAARDAVERLEKRLERLETARRRW
jgi:ubiquinone biosynthesis protein UbiJ